MSPHFMLLLSIYALYPNVTYIYLVSCLVELKLFQKYNQQVPPPPGLPQVYFLITSKKLSPISKEVDKCNLTIINQSQSYQLFARFLRKWCLNSCMITWKIMRSCINNNMAFVPTRPFYISYNTCINIQIPVMLYFIYSWIFRKAFDCVNHEILLSKLNTYCMRGMTLGLFRSYLTNEEQYVCINNVDSNP